MTIVLLNIPTTNHQPGKQTFLNRIDRSAYPGIIYMPMYTARECGKLVSAERCLQDILICRGRKAIIFSLAARSNPWTRRNRMVRKATQNHLQHADSDTAMIDLEQLADAICKEMNGQIDRQEIRHALEQIFPHYRDARIWGFVPILMRREVTEILTEGSRSSTTTVPA